MWFSTDYHLEIWRGRQIESHSKDQLTWNRNNWNHKLAGTLKIKF